MMRPILLLVAFASPVFALNEELSDAQKEEAFEARREGIERRLFDFSEAIPEETKSVVREASAYNAGKSKDLQLVREAMRPSSISLDQFYLISSLRLDTQTVSMFETLLRESDDDSVKAKVVWRIRAEALDGNLALTTDVFSLLKSYSQDENVDPNLRRASTLTLRQIDELKSKEPEAEPNLVGAVDPQDSTSQPIIEIDVSSPLVTVDKGVEELMKVELEDGELTEVAEEAPAESTNWLLWLIGALVVLGGLVVVARRKN